MQTYSTFATIEISKHLSITISTGNVRIFHHRIRRMIVELKNTKFSTIRMYDLERVKFAELGNNFYNVNPSPREIAIGAKVSHSRCSGGREVETGWAKLQVTRANPGCVFFHFLFANITYERGEERNRTNRMELSGERENEDSAGAAPNL